MVKNLANKRENWFSRVVYVRGVKVIEKNPVFSDMEWRFSSVVRFGHFDIMVLAHTADDCAVCAEALKYQATYSKTVLPVESIPGFDNVGHVSGSFATVTFKQQL